VQLFNEAGQTRKVHLGVEANEYIVGVQFNMQSKQFTLSPFCTMGGLVISRAACRAISARRRTTAHITVVSSVLCTGYVVNKTVLCVLMNMILVIII
jgi:hypothetical protein